MTSANPRATIGHPDRYNVAGLTRMANQQQMINSENQIWLRRMTLHRAMQASTYLQAYCIVYGLYRRYIVITWLASAERSTDSLWYGQRVKCTLGSVTAKEVRVIPSKVDLFAEDVSF